MKTLSLLLVAAVVTLSLPACATAPQKQTSCCSSDKSCSAPASHTHGKKKGS